MRSHLRLLGAQARRHGARSRSGWRTSRSRTTQGERFIARERLTREALGLAGASTEPLRVWVKDWSAHGRGTRTASYRCGSMLATTIALDLRPRLDGAARRARRPRARRQGRGGRQCLVLLLGAAARRGRQRDVEGETFAVTGLAWLDREWSTSSLEPGHRRLGLVRAASVGRQQLDVLPAAHGERRARARSAAERSSAPTARRTRLAASDVALTPLDHWTSAATGVRYPVAWRLAAPKAGITLEVSPYLENRSSTFRCATGRARCAREGDGPGRPVDGAGLSRARGLLNVFRCDAT